MYKLISSFVILSLIIGIQSAGLYDKTSNVVQLTPQNFGEIYTSPHVWIVEFYAPWCKNHSSDYVIERKLK